MIKAFDLPLDADIAPFCHFLRARGLPLQVIESGGRQELWVPDEPMAEQVREAYRHYQHDPELQQKLGRIDWHERPRGQASVLQQLAHFPVVAVLLASLTITGLLTAFGDGELTRHLLIVDAFVPTHWGVSQRWDLLMLTLSQGGWWRLLAPAWLHWGIFHFLFNALALWIFGRALEHYLGGGRLIGLVIASAVISNVAQYLVSGPLFGGFSGAVYALVGAQLVAQRLVPRPGFWVPSALIGFAVLSLFVGVSGLLDAFGLAVANTAHLGGLISGILCMLLIHKVFPPHRDSRAG